MIFKKIVINEKQYTEEHLEEIKNVLNKICAKHKSPMGDFDISVKEENKKPLRRKNDYLLRDALTALAVCHNVTPVKDGNETTLQVERLLRNFTQAELYVCSRLQMIYVNI